MRTKKFAFEINRPLVLVELKLGRKKGSGLFRKELRGPAYLTFMLH